MNVENSKSIRMAYHSDLVILVVEDHILFSKEIKHSLLGHKVILARSLEDARSCYDECLPNVTFLDIDLPDGTGFELLDYILGKEPEAYVAMLTGSKIEADVITSRKKGARGYIIKPFTKSKIDQHIKEYLEFREKQIKSLLEETEEHRRQELPLMPHMIIT